MPKGMMKASLITLFLTVVLGFSETNSNSLVYTNFCVRVPPQECILTITNRPYLYFETGSIIIRVTDDEWTLLTNRLYTKVYANSLSIYAPKQEEK